MERTNHVMIVGDGARRFAVDEGFEEMNLLTDHSRKIWLAWKARTSFNWRPGIDSPEWKDTVSEIFDNDPAQIAYADARHQPSAHRHDQLPRGERKGRSQRHHHHFRVWPGKFLAAWEIRPSSARVFSSMAMLAAPAPPERARKTSKLPAATPSWR